MNPGNAHENLSRPIGRLALLIVNLLLLALTLHAAPPGTAMKLNILSNRVVNTYDYLTENSFGANYYYGAGCYAYVPAEPLTNTLPFYRLYKISGNRADHMDSTVTDELGYSLEFLLGHPFASATPYVGAKGLVPLQRWWRDGFWHGTTSIGQNLGDGRAWAQGFTLEKNWEAYGFARYPAHWATFNNVQVNNGVWTTTPNQLAASGITIAGNPQWGGELVKWEWNGTQFINNNDPGRQIQVGLFVNQNNVTNWSLYPGYTPPASDPNSYFIAPTSAGDGNRNGSPCISIANDTSVAVSPKQTSECLPLEFFPQNYGGDDSHPVVYRDLLVGKTVTLNCQPDGRNRNWPVAEYVARVTMPNAVAGVARQHPTAYLRAAFRNFWKYDPKTDKKPIQVYPTPAYDPNGQKKIAFYVNPAITTDPVTGLPLPSISSGYGGMIVADTADPASNKAFGIFAVGKAAVRADGTSANGSTDQLDCWDMSFTNPPDPGEFSLDTVIVEAGSTDTLPAGLSTSKTYLMSGTLNDIQRYMNTLYAITSGGFHAGYNFQTPQNLEGWTVGHSIGGLVQQTLEDGTGVMKFNVTGSDPYLWAPNDVGINADQMRYVQIGIYAPTACTMQIFWKIAAPPNPYTNVNYPLAAGWNNVSIDMEAYNPVGWGGMVSNLRIDPTTGSSGSGFMIDFVRFSQTPAIYWPPN